MKKRGAFWNFSENSSILVASPVPKFIPFVNYSINWSVAGCLLQTIIPDNHEFDQFVFYCCINLSDKKWAIDCNSHCDPTTWPMRCHALKHRWGGGMCISTNSHIEHQSETMKKVDGEHLLVLTWFSLPGFHHGILWVGSMQGEQTITRHIWTPSPPHKVWWKLQSLPRISPRIVPTKSFCFFHP